MFRIGLGVVAGFLAWVIAWIGSEQILSAIWPEWYGVHQRAFQEAITTGGPFTADTTLLLTQIVLGPIVSVLAGLLASLVGGDHKRAPVILAVVLLALGLLKAVMSWPYVPLWYHVIFTALLVPMTILGGRLKSTT